MELVIEKQADFDNVSLMLATVNWDSAEQCSPLPSQYVLCQRLSGARTPVRIGNIDVHDALPRVGSVGFLPPDCSVALFPIEKPYRLLVCSFEKEYFESTTAVTRAQWDAHTGLLVSIRNNRLELLMQEIHAELENPGFGHEKLIESLNAHLLIELARYARELERQTCRQGDSLALAPWQLSRIQERIDNGPELGYPRLKELAELCTISPSHLARCFKSSTGWQIHKFVAEQRMNKAKVLLAEHGVTCQEVSARLGFSSPAYFATAFRRQTGLTPMEYRNQVTAAIADRSAAT